MTVRLSLSLTEVCSLLQQSHIVGACFKPNLILKSAIKDLKNEALV